MKKTIYTFIITNYLTVAAILIAQAQDGSLDPTFGTGGKVITFVGDAFSSGRSVAIQSDGKIVVAGTSTTIDDRQFFALARYNNDGTLDNSFDTDGMVITAIGNNMDTGVSIAIQGDGKIVVAGSSWNSAYLVDFALVRYNTDGTLDTTFSSDGKVTTDFGSDYDFGYSVAIQDDGKIVVAGESYNGIDRDFALARYNTDGTLDTTFSSDGKVTTDFGSGDDEGNSVSIQDDGKIVVAGESYIDGFGNFALVRYNPDGTLDTSFNTDGKVFTKTGFYNSNAYSVAIQKDGKIVAAGRSIGGTGAVDFTLVRYNVDGTLDETFDSDCKVIPVIGSYENIGSTIAIQEDGKIVMVGTANYIFNSYFVVVRYKDDGTLDNSFSMDGIVTTDFGDSSDVAFSVAIQGDGKIVVSGRNRFMYAVARYNVGTVGIAENNADENTLTLSPNPFNNEIFINGTKENDEILIFDEMGNEMICEKTFDTETKINTEKLLPGFYFLNYTDGNKSSITKMLKF